jgi:hypothetical protein
MDIRARKHARVRRKTHRMPKVHSERCCNRRREDTPLLRRFVELGTPRASPPVSMDWDDGAPPMSPMRHVRGEFVCCERLCSSPGPEAWQGTQRGADQTFMQLCSQRPCAATPTKSLGPLQRLRLMERERQAEERMRRRLKQGRHLAHQHSERLRSLARTGASSVPLRNNDETALRQRGRPALSAPRAARATHTPQSTASPSDAPGVIYRLQSDLGSPASEYITALKAHRYFGGVLRDYARRPPPLRSLSSGGGVSGQPSMVAQRRLSARPSDAGVRV